MFSVRSIEVALKVLINVEKDINTNSKSEGGVSLSVNKTPDVF